MDVCVESDTIITVRPSRTKASSMYYQLQHLKQHITKVIIKGLPSVNRAVINQVSINALCIIIIGNLFVLYTVSSQALARKKYGKKYFEVVLSIYILSKQKLPKL